MTHTNTASPALVRFREACSLLGIHVDTGRKLVREGTFPVPVERIGDHYKVRRADLDRYLAGAVDEVERSRVVDAGDSADSGTTP